MAAGSLLGCSTPRPVLSAPAHPPEAGGESAEVHVRECLSIARGQRAGSGKRWKHTGTVLLTTFAGALTFGAISARDAAFRDDIATATAAGAVAGAVLGLGAGLWLEKRESDKDFRGRVAECLREHGHRIRAWE